MGKGRQDKKHACTHSDKRLVRISVFPPAFMSGWQPVRRITDHELYFSHAADYANRSIGCIVYCSFRRHPQCSKSVFASARCSGFHRWASVFPTALSYPLFLSPSLIPKRLYAYTGTANHVVSEPDLPFPIRQVQDICRTSPCAPHPPSPGGPASALLPRLQS